MTGADKTGAERTGTVDATAAGEIAVAELAPAAPGRRGCAAPGMLALEAGAEGKSEGIEPAAAMRECAPSSVALFATNACGVWAPAPADADAAALRDCACSSTASITATHCRISPVYCGSLHSTVRARLMSSRQPKARCEELSPRSSAIGISAASKR